jgi:hypothetical protein
MRGAFLEGGMKTGRISPRFFKTVRMLAKKPLLVLADSSKTPDFKRFFPNLT